MVFFEMLKIKKLKKTFFGLSVIDNMYQNRKNSFFIPFMVIVEDVFLFLWFF